MLVHGESQNASLIFLDADEMSVPIGKLHQVDFAEATQHDGWTFRPDINAYFVAK
jgi:hypothetical protein